MGFLDKQSRVVDFVLTERGRRLYATGQLDFAYFSLFDDGVDYDPYSTGSLSHEERELLVEDVLMLEAPFIHEVRGAEGPLEPRSHIFTAAPGYLTVPHMSSPVDGGTISIMCEQLVDADGTYQRRTSTTAVLDLAVTGEVEVGNPGFLVRVFTSGSVGLNEIDPRRDLSGRRVYDPFLAISVDTGDLTVTRRGGR